MLVFLPHAQTYTAFLLAYIVPVNNFLLLPDNQEMDVRHCRDMPLIVVVHPTEVTIKQEEDTAEEADNRSPAITEEEGTLEESITGSPNNYHDRLAGPNVAADTGNRQPNGTSQQSSFCRTLCDYCKIPATTHCDSEEKQE